MDLVKMEKDLASKLIKARLSGDDRVASIAIDSMCQAYARFHSAIPFWELRNKESKRNEKDCGLSGYYLYKKYFLVIADDIDAALDCELNDQMSKIALENHCIMLAKMFIEISDLFFSESSSDADIRYHHNDAINKKLKNIKSIYDIEKTKTPKKNGSILF